MTTKPQPPLGTGDPGRPGSDKLAELERRYRGEPKRSVSPSPESGDAVRVTVPGFHLSMRPGRAKRAFPWVLAGLGFCGITGSSVAGYFAGLNAGRARIAAVEAEQVEQKDQLSQIRATQTSQAARLLTLEGAPNAPLIVKGAR